MSGQLSAMLFINLAVVLCVTSWNGDSTLTLNLNIIYGPRRSRTDTISGGACTEPGQPPYKLIRNYATHASVGSGACRDQPTDATMRLDTYDPSSHHSKNPAHCYAMKSRHLFYSILALSLLVLGWMLLVVKPLIPSANFALNFLGDFSDLVHAASRNSSASYVNSFLNTSQVGARPYDLPVATWRPFYNASHIFDNTAVISLPHRTDRRASMELLRHSLSLNWTYVDATPANHSTISQLMDCVRFRRNGSGPVVELDEFAWPQTFDTAVSMESWCPQTHSTEVGSILHISDTGPAPIPLTCATRNATVGLPYDASTPPHMLLTPAKLACWHSHIRVLESFSKKRPPDPSEIALVLEDDVNMERDIRTALPELFRYMPQTWDIIFLGRCLSSLTSSPVLTSAIRAGHCWSNESYHPAIGIYHSSRADGGNVSIHPSFAPKCTHAYAVSNSGATKLLQHLHHPPFAYSRALDQAYAWLVMSGRVESYSVVPSVVVQRKLTLSDVDGGRAGMGSDWREGLVDGVLVD